MVRSSNSRLSWLAPACGAVALAASALAWSQDCDSGTYQERLAKRYNDVCQRQNSLQKRREAIRRPLLEAKTAEERAGIVLAQLEEQVARLPDAKDNPSVFQESAAKLKALLERAVRALRNVTLKEHALNTDYWGEPSDTDGLAAGYLRTTQCYEKADDACAANYALATELGDRVFLVRNSLGPLTLDARKAAYARLEQLGDRWHSYLYDPQFPYFWELAFNRWLLEDCKLPNRLVSAALGEECKGVIRDAAGNQIRWREVPRYRAVFLHPDIGFQYNRDEPKGQRAKPSLVFQWFGYQWWSWDANNKVSDLRGLSLVSTVSDNANSRALGIGLQGQYDKYSLAITSHGGKPVFAFSMDLLGKVSKLDEEYADKLRKP